MNNRASSAPITTARSHIEGSLVTTSLDRVLAACRRSQMTGLVRVEGAGKAGQVQLRAGSIACAPTTLRAGFRVDLSKLRCRQFSSIATAH